MVNRAVSLIEVTVLIRFFKFPVLNVFMLCVKTTAMPNNSMDVRAKQLLSYLACPFPLTLRGGGFAPRHLKRYAPAL